MLSTIDNIIVIMAIIGMIGVAAYFSKAATDMESFYVCNKSLPWALTVGTLVATWYGGVGTLGSVEWFAVFGASMFLAWCITAHIGRLPLALWIGPSMQLRTDLTVSDVLRKNYGQGVAIIGSVLMIVYTCQFGNITSSGFVAKIAWGMPYMVTGIIVVGMVIFIAVASGLMGVAITDMIMFLFLGSAVAITVPVQWGRLGGWATIETALAGSPELLDPFGGLTLFQALSFAIVALTVYADPAFYQRFSAANSPRAGRRAMLICLAIWLVMDLSLMATGLMVTAIHPEMAPGLGYVTLVLETLPTGFRALFVVAIIGSAISYLDSYLLCGGTIFAHDIVAQINKKLNDKQELTISRITIVVLGIIGLLVAFKVTLAQDFFYITSQVWCAGGVIPVAGGLIYKGKKTPVGGFASMLGGIGTFIYLLVFPITDIEPLPICFLVSFVLYIIGNRFGRPIYDENELKLGGN